MSHEEITAEQLTTRTREQWARRGAIVGLHFEVPPCPYTHSDLRRLASAGRQATYLPPELATVAARPRLAEIFPLMGSYAFWPGNPFLNDIDHAGWFDYAAVVDAPLRELDQASTMTVLEERGERLLTLNEYAVASQDHHERTGRYLDERATWARLGSRIDGRLVAARFDGAEMAEGLGEEPPVDGSLLVAYDLSADDRARVLGARTSTRTTSSSPPIDPLALTADDESARDHDIPRLSGPPGDDERAAVRRRTCDIYVALGFHDEIGMTESAYRQSLPTIGPQPAALRGRLDVPVLVETRIPWRRQAELGGVRFSYGVRTSEVADIDRSPRPRRPKPYVMWCNEWGARFPLPIAPGEVRGWLAADEICATIDELLAVELTRPGLSASGRFFEAAGSRMVDLVDAVPTGSGLGERYPVLYRWRGHAELGSNLTPRAYSIYRPLVRAVDPPL